MAFLNPSLTKSLRENNPRGAAILAANTARELIDAVVMRQKVRQENLEPSGGAYYFVRYPLGWDIYAVRDAEWGHMDHPDLWAELVVPQLAGAWSKALKMPAKGLEKALRLHSYGFPRGRVTGHGHRWLVLHGGDAKTISKPRLERAFQITGMATWERDMHEQCQKDDRDALRRILKLKDNWPAVGVDYGWDD